MNLTLWWRRFRQPAPAIDLTPGFVTHLRSVHFAQMVVCVVTLVAAFGRQSPQVLQAETEFRNVLLIQDQWPAWLQDWGRRATAEFTLATTRPAVTIPSTVQVCSVNGANWQLTFVGMPILFRPSGSVPPIAEVERSIDKELVIKDLGHRPQNLREFRNFWDASRDLKLRVVVRLAPDIQFLTAGSEPQFHPWTTGRCPDLPRNLSATMRLHDTEKECPRAVFTDALKGTQKFCADVDTFSLVIPAELDFDVRNPEDLQQWLGRRYGLGTVGGGFEKDFPALARMTAQTQGNTFAESYALYTELKAATENRSRLQLIGIDFPAETLSIVAPVIIIASQLYLWLYVAQLAGARWDQSGKDPRVDWVALHRSVVAVGMTWLTLALLPTSAIAAAMYDEKSIGLAVGGGAVGLWLGIVVVRAIWRCRRRLPGDSKVASYE